MGNFDLTQTGQQVQDTLNQAPQTATDLEQLAGIVAAHTTAIQNLSQQVGNSAYIIDLPSATGTTSVDVEEVIDKVETTIFTDGSGSVLEVTVQSESSFTALRQTSESDGTITTTVYLFQIIGPDENRCTVIPVSSPGNVIDDLSDFLPISTNTYVDLTSAQQTRMEAVIEGTRVGMIDGMLVSSDADGRIQIFYTHDNATNTILWYEDENVRRRWRCEVYELLRYDTITRDITSLLTADTTSGTAGKFYARYTISESALTLKLLANPILKFRLIYSTGINFYYEFSFVPTRLFTQGSTAVKAMYFTGVDDTYQYQFRLVPSNTAGVWELLLTATAL